MTALESFSLLADEKKTGEEGEGEMLLAGAVPGASDRYTRDEGPHCDDADVENGHERAALVLLVAVSRLGEVLAIDGRERRALQLEEAQAAAPPLPLPLPASPRRAPLLSLKDIREDVLMCRDIRKEVSLSVAGMSWSSSD